MLREHLPPWEVKRPRGSKAPLLLGVCYQTHSPRSWVGAKAEEARGLLLLGARLAEPVGVSMITQSVIRGRETSSSGKALRECTNTSHKAERHARMPSVTSDLQGARCSESTFLLGKSRGQEGRKPLCSSECATRPILTRSWVGAKAEEARGLLLLGARLEGMQGCPA